MAGWLHGVSVGEWLFVFPLCGFSLSLFCNYRSRRTGAAPAWPQAAMQHERHVRAAGGDAASSTRHVFREAAVRWSTWARAHEVAGDRRIVWYGRCAWQRLATLAQQSASLLQPLSTGSHLPVRERVEHSPRPPTRNLQSQYGPFSACACTPQPAQRHTHATHAFDPAHPKPSTSVTQETSARSRHSVSPDVRTMRTSF